MKWQIVVIAVLTFILAAVAGVLVSNAVMFIP